MDTVIHLAADPRPDAPWESLLRNNIQGTVNICEAALAAGCRPERAAFLGAWAHASTLDHLPPVGVVASDLIAALPLALASMGAKPSDSRSFRAHAAPPRPLPASMGAHTSDSRSFRAHAGGGQAWVRARGRP